MDQAKERKRAVSRIGYNLRLTEALYDRLSAHAYETGQSMNETINRGVAAFLEQERAAE